MWAADWQDDSSVVLIDEPHVEDGGSGNAKLFWLLPALLPKQTCFFYIVNEWLNILIAFALMCIKLDVFDFKPYPPVEYKLASKTFQCWFSTNAMTMQKDAFLDKHLTKFINLS